MIHPLIHPLIILPMYHPWIRPYALFAYLGELNWEHQNANMERDDKGEEGGGLSPQAKGMGCRERPRDEPIVNTGLQSASNRMGSLATFRNHTSGPSLSSFRSSGGSMGAINSLKTSNPSSSSSLSSNPSPMTSLKDAIRLSAGPRLLNSKQVSLGGPTRDLKRGIAGAPGTSSTSARPIRDLGSAIASLSLKSKPLSKGIGRAQIGESPSHSSSSNSMVNPRPAISSLSDLRKPLSSARSQGLMDQSSPSPLGSLGYRSATRTKEPLPPSPHAQVDPPRARRQEDPLLATPSPFARDIFAPLSLSMPPSLQDQQILCMVQDTLANSLNPWWGLGEDQEMVDSRDLALKVFSTDSPDDIVLKAQSQWGGCLSLRSEDVDTRGSEEGESMQSQPVLSPGSSVQVE